MSELNRIQAFINRVVIRSLVKFLKEGLTPEKLSLCVALGITLGIFPVIGSTTFLCAALAFTFRLNMPAIQLINYFAYPIQLILFIPFIRAGEFLFDQSPIPLDLAEIYSLLKTDTLQTIQSLWWTNLRAIVAWIVVALPLGVIVYFCSLPIFLRFVTTDNE